MQYSPRFIGALALMLTLCPADGYAALITYTGNGVDDSILQLRSNQVHPSNLNSEGNQTDEFSFHSTISGDGRTVAYISDATNLVAEDLNDSSDIFVYDRLTKETRLVSRDTDCTQANDFSQYPDISGNGRFVVFE